MHRFSVGKKLAAVLLLFLASTLTRAAEENRNHKKRQIYREQVLPHAGGRIPDTAFDTDRLFLNRLQKEGIAVPDGILLEQRNPQVYPFYNRDHRAVFRIALSSDGRYVAKDGRYQYNELPTIETTYLYPQIHGEKTISMPKAPSYPVYKQFQLHNSQLNQPKLQPKKKAQPPNKEPVKAVKTTTSYQNFNIIHNHLSRQPLAAAPPKTNFFTPSNLFEIPPHQPYLGDFAHRSPFNEFNHYFNHFDLYDPNANGNDFFNKDHIIDLPITGFSSTPDQLLY